MNSPSRLSTRRLVSPAIRVVHPVSRAQPARISSRPPFVHPSRSTAPLRDAFDAAHLCEIRVPPPPPQCPAPTLKPKKVGNPACSARTRAPRSTTRTQVLAGKKGKERIHDQGPAGPRPRPSSARNTRNPPAPPPAGQKKKNAKPLSGPPYQRTRRFHHRGPSILAAHARSAAQVHFGLSLGDREGGCWRCG